jgi:hypothetical protein
MFVLALPNAAQQKIERVIVIPSQSFGSLDIVIQFIKMNSARKMIHASRNKIQTMWRDDGEKGKPSEKVVSPGAAVRPLTVYLVEHFIERSTKMVVNQLYGQLLLHDE